MHNLDVMSAFGLEKERDDRNRNKSKSKTSKENKSAEKEASAKRRRFAASRIMPIYCSRDIYLQLERSVIMLVNIHSAQKKLIHWLL